MTTRTCLIPSGARRRALWILPLALLLAAEAGAAPQDIDIDCAPAPAIHVINVPTGVVVAGQDIGVLDAAANVFWDFAVAPAGCAGGPTSFNCNGVTITLPAGSPGASVSNAAKVALASTPTAAGSFSFQLQVATDDGDGLPACSREYHLVITEPFDTVFVLDRSGSMSGTSKIVPPATDRWDALKTGVNAFTPMIASVAAPGSRFGLTLFGTTVLANNSFPAGLVAIDSLLGGLPAAVNAELISQSPGGATAMGAGLKDALTDLADPTRPRIVVLFTDGEQNQIPDVDDGGCTFDGGATRVNPLPCPAGAGTIKVVTVGIGSPEADYLTTLQNLAHNNRGHSIITGNAASFTGDCTGNPTDAFICAIQPTLSGNSPQMIASFSGPLTGTVNLPAFDVNRFGSQLLLQLSVSRKFETPQLVGLLRGLRIERDGTDVTRLFRPVIVGNFSNSLLLQGDFTAAAVPSEGSYVVTLQAPSGTAAPLQYRLVAFVDDHRLGFDWQVDPAAPRVGEKWRPTVDLSWLSRPVTDAKVEAVILKPGDDLGDLLARHPFKVDVKEGTDAGSAGVQKYLALLNDRDFLKRLLPAEQRLTLTHQGGGIYSADFDPGDVSGVYQVLYTVQDDDPAVGKVQRLAAQSVYVRFGAVDLDASAVATTVSANGVTINFRPATKTGRFVGPGNASAISVTGSGIRVRSIADHQDGSYTVELAGDPTTKISVGMLGDEIYSGPAGGFGLGPDGGTGTRLCERWPRGLRWLCRLFRDRN